MNYKDKLVCIDLTYSKSEVEKRLQGLKEI